MNERHLDPPLVRALGHQFALMARTLQAMRLFLQVQSDVCRAAAFIGLVGAKAAERHLSTVKPRVDQLIVLCEELSQDAIRSADNWERITRAD